MNSRDCDIIVKCSACREIKNCNCMDESTRARSQGKPTEAEARPDRAAGGSAAGLDDGWGLGRRLTRPIEPDRRWQKQSPRPLQPPAVVIREPNGTDSRQSPRGVSGGSRRSDGLHSARLFGTHVPFDCARRASIHSPPLLPIAASVAPACRPAPTPPRTP